MAGFGSADHAIIVGLDGLSTRSLHHAIDTGMAPTLASLRARGAYTDDARCMQPSVSFPNWASILTGAPPSLHGVHLAKTFDDMVRPATFVDATLWPNLFASARVQRPELTTAAYYSWPPLSQLLEPATSLNTSVLMPCLNCDECLAVEPRLLSAYLAGLQRERFQLSWLYIDLLDECGHKRGDSHPSYVGLVRKVDRMLAELLHTLRAAAMLDRTAMLILSDHGREARHGKGHGGFTTAEMAVQWLLVAPGVRQGQLSSPVSIIDSAPTLLHALGIVPPVHMYGRVVSEAFRGAPVGWAASAVQRPAALPPASPLGMQGVVAASTLRALEALRRIVDALQNNLHRPSMVMGGVCGVLLSVVWMRMLRRERDRSSGHAMYSPLAADPASSAGGRRQWRRGAGPVEGEAGLNPSVA